MGSIALPCKAGVQWHQGDVLSDSRYPGKVSVAFYLFLSFLLAGPPIHRHGEKWFFWVLTQRRSSCPSPEVWECA